MIKTCFLFPFYHLFLSFLQLISILRQQCRTKNWWCVGFRIISKWYFMVIVLINHDLCTADGYRKHVPFAWETWKPDKARQFSPLNAPIPSTSTALLQVLGMETSSALSAAPNGETSLSKPLPTLVILNVMAWVGPVSLPIILLLKIFMAKPLVTSNHYPHSHLSHATSQMMSPLWSTVQSLQTLPHLSHSLGPSL